MLKHISLLTAINEHINNKSKTIKIQLLPNWRYFDTAWHTQNSDIFANLVFISIFLIIYVNHVSAHINREARYKYSFIYFF